MQPLISIIIPVFNGENYLTAAINSALEQDYRHKEIIVVDDGSTDNTASLVAKFSRQVKYIFQPNKGLGASRNTGVQFASGNYLTFLDHDDLWCKNKLTLQMNVLNKQANDPIVFGHAEQFFCPTLLENEKATLRIDQKKLPAYHAGTLLLTKKRFTQIGNFFEKNQIGEFVDWYLRALEKKIPVLMLEAVLMYRRIHKKNMGLQHDKYNRNDYLKIIKASLMRRRLDNIGTIT